MRRGLGRAVLASLLLTLGVARAEEVSLGLDQALWVARQAQLSGDHALANALARRVAEARPEDARALLLMAATETALGRPGEGRRFGRKAWGKAGEEPGLRHEIARHTAYAAMADGSPLMAQFWLRRAVDTAATPEERAQDIADVRQVRAGTRLKFALDLAVAPSNNLNNGAQGGLLVIDGDYVVGPLSGAAQALSGTLAVVQARLSYALPARAQSQTTLGVRLYQSFNWLSDEAKDLAPEIRGSDLNQTTLEAVVDHGFRLGSSQVFGLSVAAGNSWVGAYDIGEHLRLELAYPLLTSERRAVRLKGSVERQFQEPGAVTAEGLTLEGVELLPRGDRFGWSLTARDVTGPSVNDSYRSLAGEVSYAFAEPLGPVTLAARLGAGMKDYPDFLLGPFAVTEGRRDEYLAASLDLSFPDVGMLGYVPTVSLTGRDTKSNVSRYETEQYGISFGFASSF